MRDFPRPSEGEEAWASEEEEIGEVEEEEGC